MNELKKLIDGLGREYLANALDVSRGMISHLYTGKRKPSPRVAKAIEKLTDGKIQKSQLRPDIFCDDKENAA